MKTHRPMSRMTDNDRTWGPFTWGPWSKTIKAVYRSGGGEDEECRNSVFLCGFGWALRVWLPFVLRPWREVRQSYADSNKMVTELWPREYGFSLCDMGNGYDFLIVYLGAQTHDSDTTQSLSKHLPWMQWDHVRHSLYCPDGTHFYTEPYWRDIRKAAKKNGSIDKSGWNETYKKMEEVPKVHFAFKDYDGEPRIATCYVEEREWHKGTGWFRWLKRFSKPKIVRSLDLAFDYEIGPEKGSWKGGTTGHGIDMRHGETPKEAFVRYCEMEHERKGRKYKLTFIGPCGPPEPREIRVARNRGWVQDASGLWRLTGSLGVGISTEEMLARIKADQDVNNAQIAGQLKG